MTMVFLLIHAERWHELNDAQRLKNNNPLG